MSERSLANRILFMNTVAYTVFFAVWTMYGVLVTFLVDQQVVDLDKAQIGWLIGIPILTGSVLMVLRPLEGVRFPPEQGCSDVPNRSR